MKSLMSAESLRILVVGAGVNGSVCGAALQRAGFSVTLLARGRRFEELKERGVEIEDPIKNFRTITRVPVIDHLAPDDVYEYILVVVRKNQVPDLLPVLSQNRSPSVVFMVNTASGHENWVRALGAHRVMLGFVFAGGRREGSLIRAIRGRGGSTPFGEIDGTTTRRLTRLVSILNRAGLRSKATAKMSDWLATHAAMVVPLAMLILRARLRHLRAGSLQGGSQLAGGGDARDPRCASLYRPPHSPPRRGHPRDSPSIHRRTSLPRVDVFENWGDRRWLALFTST